MTKVRYLNLKPLADELLELRDKRDSTSDSDEEMETDERDRLDDLENLARQLRVDDLDECNSVKFIDDSDFEDYAREHAEELNPVLRDGGWPFDSIDWQSAAEDLKQDYTPIDFDGTTFWMES